MEKDTNLVFEFNGREAADAALRQLEVGGIEPAQIRMHGHEKGEFGKWDGLPVVVKSILMGAAVSIPVATTLGLILGMASYGSSSNQSSYLGHIGACIALTVFAGLIASSIIGAAYGAVDAGKEAPDWVLRRVGGALRPGRFMIRVDGDAATLARAAQALGAARPAPRFTTPSSPLPLAGA